MKPFVDAGQLSIHWMMISIDVKLTSKGVALAIYDGKAPKPYPRTPTGAFEYDEDFFDIVNEYGGLAPQVKASFEAINIFNRNQQFFISQTEVQSPFIIYKNAQGQASYLPGLPSDPTAFFNSLFVE
jgi:hypothetical protein